MQEKTAQENIIKFIMLGMLTAYKQGFLEFDEFHFSLFAPKGATLMRKNNFSEDIADFIEIGMELEDIHRLIGIEYRDQKITELETSIMQSIRLKGFNRIEDIDLLFQAIQAIAKQQTD